MKVFKMQILELKERAEKKKFLPSREHVSYKIEYLKLHTKVEWNSSLPSLSV